MNKMITSVLMSVVPSVLMFFACVASATSNGPAFFARERLPRIDDRELAGPRPPGARLTPALAAATLVPDRVEVGADPNQLTIQVVREDHGRLTPVNGLTFSAHPNGCDPAPVTAPLENRWLDVTNGRDTYQIAATVSCRGLYRLIFRQDSPAGQVIGLWQVAQRGLEKVRAEIGVGFWNRAIPFVVPADGDYYDSSVHITRGDAWDVVGHEMGHAIYDLGAIGRFGGGSHKIDECYSDALALSEGWASYFSAWVSVDLHDADAKFEYMVPRRAPIRFERIPADVCRGPQNEWRVTGFFWDLVDFANDGETAETPFRAVWEALTGRRAGNMVQVMTALQQKGFDPALLQRVWDLNFQGAASSPRR